MWGAPHAVIARWKVHLGSGLGPLAQQLVAFKPMEEGLENVGESSVETLVDGMNEFATRIPIPEYARVGLRGPTATLYCDAVPNSFLGVVEGSFPAGQTRNPSSQLDKGAPVVAIIEPDRDGDGYGDSTQDQCQSFGAASRARARTSRSRAGSPGCSGRRSSIEVTTNVNTEVAVRARSSRPLRPKRKRGAQRSKAAAKRTFLLAGGTQQIAAAVPGHHLDSHCPEW